MRFYAEVQIRTTTGFQMGSYCIVDNKLREGLDSAGIRKLAEIANAVTRHLELVQARKSLERSREMVKGLGLFAEGRPSLREWWTDAFKGQGQRECLDEPPSGEHRGRHCSGITHTLSIAS